LLSGLATAPSPKVGRAVRMQPKNLSKDWMAPTDILIVGRLREHGIAVPRGKNRRGQGLCRPKDQTRGAGAIDAAAAKCGHVGRDG